MKLDAHSLSIHFNIGQPVFVFVNVMNWIFYSEVGGDQNRTKKEGEGECWTLTEP